MMATASSFELITGFSRGLAGRATFCSRLLRTSALTKAMVFLLSSRSSLAFSWIIWSPKEARSVFTFFLDFISLPPILGWASPPVKQLERSASRSKVSMSSLISSNCLSALLRRKRPRMILNLSLRWSVDWRKCILKMRACFCLRPQASSFHLSCTSHIFSIWSRSSSTRSIGFSLLVSTVVESTLRSSLSSLVACFLTLF
mmetsp:Transcript_7480/g.12645  ORF Transcript_7480/g.12645 Transcript_7480/m.12645 type:complete len:201 (-) Transcript_7480:104-706(-)